MEFYEVREYQPGDEVRLIDWNVSARNTNGKVFIKKYVEERELTVMILLDASSSTSFGTVNTLKRDLAAELSSVLAGSAVKNNDRVGLVIFTDRIEKFIPPRKGIHHIFRVIRETLYFKPKGTGTDIKMALDYLGKVLTKSAIVFLISDFYSKDIKRTLAVSNKRHDIIAVNILDPRDLDMPEAGVVNLFDPELRRGRHVDTGNKDIRESYRKSQLKRLLEVKKIFYSTNVDNIEIRTDRPYADAFVEFFNRRKIKQ
jgi:uncharacterized protein (DUF58 family)